MLIKSCPHDKPQNQENWPQVSHHGLCIVHATDGKSLSLKSKWNVTLPADNISVSCSIRKHCHRQASNEFRTGHQNYFNWIEIQCCCLVEVFSHSSCIKLIFWYLAFNVFILNWNCGLQFGHINKATRIDGVPG